jgi:hypothetical protein
MGDLSERSQEILSVFSKYGFVFHCEQKNTIIFFRQGTEFGIYLEFFGDVFSVECFINPFSQKIFYWQRYDSLEEVESLLFKNHILSEQVFENYELAGHF